LIHHGGGEQNKTIKVQIARREKKRLKGDSGVESHFRPLYCEGVLGKKYI
jgi:hypothetical protein